jgi:hypothetical protein
MKLPHHIVILKIYKAQKKIDVCSRLPDRPYFQRRP